MAEDIIIRYVAEVDQLTGEINRVIVANEKLEKSAEDLSKDQTKAANLTAKSYEKTADAATKAATAAQKTGTATTNAAKQTTRAADEASKAFAKTSASAKKAGDDITTSFKGAGSSIKNIGLSIAAGFGAAFSVDAIIQFAKSSINAFIEAEKNAQKLRFAITSIGGESEAAFDRLIKQSEQLQDITVFSDDSIQQAQAALAAFGLTSDEIEDLLPKLADFATVSGVDIVQAAEQVGAGLEGAGREFKKYGIEVSATASRLDNLNSISEGFTKFTGSAAEATKTFAGQLEQLNNRADDLQESVGEKLAPAWTKVKIAIFEAVQSLLTYGRTQDELIERAENIGGAAGNALISSLKEQGKSYEQITTVLEGLIDINQKEVDALELNYQLRVRAGDLNRVEAEQEKQKIALKKALILEYQNELGSLQRNEENSKRILTTEKLRAASVKELNELLRINSIENDLIAQSNVQSIEKELEARKKQAAAELKVQQERVKAQLDAERKIKESIERENIARQQRVDDIIKGAEEANQRKLILEDQFLSELDKKNQARIEKAKKDEADRLEKIKSDQEDLADALRDGISELTASLSGLFSDIANQRINEISNQFSTFEDGLTKEEDALKTSKDRRLISESDYQTKKAAIDKKRIEQEEKVAKEINKLKRRQLIIDKTIALIEIGLSLQKAIAAYASNPVTALLIPVITGVITAALAAASAFTIPAFAKGTKGKRGSGMALVGEEGAEQVFLPGGAKVLPAKQTKTYGEVFDAMYDNRFEKYVMQKYVTPALMEQKKRFEENKQSAFASNIVNSMQVNGLTTNDLLYANRKGTKITNADELALAIANQLKSDRPDLWRM